MIDVGSSPQKRLEAFTLSVLTTVLVFVGIPLVFILVVATIVRAGSDSGRPSRRYRPGRPYDFAPMWFLSAPERVSSAVAIGGREPEKQQAIEAGIIEDAAGNPVRPGPTGGASDRW